MKQEDIDRLKALAAVKKLRAFTSEEHIEYEQLKQVYVKSVKENMKMQLEAAGIKQKK